MFGLVDGLRAVSADRVLTPFGLHPAQRENDFRRDKDDFVLLLRRCCADKAPELVVRAARDAGRRLVALTKCREPDEREYCERVVQPLLGDDVEWLEEPPKERLPAQGRALVMPIQWDEPFGLS
jgi:hypothetical protein